MRLLRNLLLAVGMLAAAAWIALWLPKGPWHEVPAGTDIFDVVAGQWDWASSDSLCVASPHTISFAPDRSRMFITHSRPWTDTAGVEHRISEYEIREVSSAHIRGFLLGETRRTWWGQLVVWDLVLLDPDTYAWHRTD